MFLPSHMHTHVCVCELVARGSEKRDREQPSVMEVGYWFYFIYLLAMFVTSIQPKPTKKVFPQPPVRHLLTASETVCCDYLNGDVLASFVGPLNNTWGSLTVL